MLKFKKTFFLIFLISIVVVAFLFFEKSDGDTYENKQLGIIDSVGLYQKNGRIESYGLDTYQMPLGPIKVTDTTLNPTENLSALVWFPDRISVNADNALYLKIPKNNTKDINNIFMGIVTNKGILIFGNKNEIFNIKESNLELPDDVKGFFSNPVTKWESNNHAGEYTSKPLSSYYDKQNVVKSDPLEIKAIFILAKNMKGKKLQIDNFLITSTSLPESPDKKDKKIKKILKKLKNVKIKKKETREITLTGQLQGAKVPVGDYVYLRTEDNKIRKTQLNLEGRFIFTDLTPGLIVSIWYPYKEMDYYINVGRWFEVSNNSDNLTIDLTPQFLNVTGAIVDPKSYKFVGKKVVAPQDNDYEPHVRMAWHGLSIIQCYENFPFTNNFGYLDRDRRKENPGNCLRIVHVGGSSSAALQVKTYEKFNILLEQELGVKLGRCVEVISIARDNGDIGTHFKRLKYFTENFKPDLVLIENLSGLMMQIQPELLKRLHGFDFEHNIFPHFYYNNGELKFADLSTDYAFFMHTKDLNPLTDNVPFVESLSVPFSAMDPLAKDAWKYLKDIFMYYQKLYPKQKFALHTGIDLAHCKYPCISNTSSGGFLYGPHIFEKNHKEFCQKEDVVCFSPEINERLNKPDTLLAFTYDGHYSHRGHQWLAKELGRLLESYFKGNQKDPKND